MLLQWIPRSGDFLFSGGLFVLVIVIDLKPLREWIDYEEEDEEEDE